MQKRATTHVYVCPRALFGTDLSRQDQPGCYENITGISWVWGMVSESLKPQERYQTAMP